MAEKKFKTTSPFFYNGVDAVAQSKFEDNYESITILDKVEKTGEGDNDFVIVKTVQKDYTPIRDIIDADAESVGVYNIMKMVARTGDTSLLPVDKGDCNVDLTNAPEDLMQLKQIGINAQSAFNRLPEDITKGQDIANFINNMSQEKFDALIKAIADRNVVKNEGD